MVTHSFDLLDIFFAYTQSLDAMGLIFHAQSYQFKTKTKNITSVKFQLNSNV